MSEHSTSAPACSDGARYYTVAQLADLLQVDKSTITRLAGRDTTLPVLRISGIGGARGVLRFPADEIHAWLRARTTGGKREGR